MTDQGCSGTDAIVPAVDEYLSERIGRTDEDDW